MIAITHRTSARWLVGIAAVALIALALIAVEGHVAASPERATGSDAAGSPSLHSPARAETAYTAVSTVTLPCVFKNLSAARLFVEKVAFPTSLITGPGQLVTYTVTIRNEGDTTGTLLSIVDTLPEGFQFSSMSPAGDVTKPPDAVTGRITWTGSWTMAPAGEVTLIYRVIASQTAGDHTNEVYVTADKATVPAEPAQAVVTVLPSTLMHEDFNAGIGAWTPFLYHHRLSPTQWYYGPSNGTDGSGALTHDASLGDEVASDGLMMYLQPGAEEWTDYRVEADMYLTGGISKEWVVQPEQGDPIGFWIRGHYQESEYESQWVSGYYVVVVGESNSTNHAIKLSKMQNPDDCDACEKPYRMYNFDNPLEKAWSEPIPGPFEHYRWYHLTVDVRGAEIKVYLDNDLVLEWTDPVAPYLSGTVGFKTHETMTASFDNVTVTPLD